jgi:hypothetical protein
VVRDLRARGEDVARFASLHRELIAWLRPGNPRTRVMVGTLAEAWWEKLRRVRNWVGAGTPDTSEIDARISELLERFVVGRGFGNRKWRHRLESTFGSKLPGPSLLRQTMEARLPSLGGKPPARERLSWRKRLENRRLELEGRHLEAEAWNTARLTARARQDAAAGAGHSKSAAGYGTDREIALLLAILAEMERPPKVR